MTDTWSRAHEIWDECFQPLRDAGLELERVAAADYWKLHEAEMRAHFPAEAFIDTPALRTQAARDAQRELEAARGGQPLVDCTVAREGDRIAAMFAGELKAPDTYRMWHTNVHTDFRRRGIYRGLLAATIDYTAALGVDTITSEHALCNNAVLIAKLSAGFRIAGFDVTPMVGPSIHLVYFHNPDHLASYEFRCGMATLNERILDHGMGAMDRLVDQFRNAPRHR